jgi:acetyl esterase/lipase
MMHDTIPLWSGMAPGALGDQPADIPTMTRYEPEGAKNSAAVLVFPGGGYTARMDYEGEAYAEWLARSGYTCFVVNYRLTPDGYSLPVIFQDAVRAVRWARIYAGKFGYDSNKIGVIGSSAGGHLCANLSVHWDTGDPTAVDAVERVCSRPDLVVLCYPATYLRQALELVQLFAGRIPDKSEVAYFSASRHVRKDTPPAFLFHTSEDHIVPLNHTLRFAAALERNKVPVEVHVYERGPHGVALGNGHPWTAECLRWLTERFGA